MGATSVNTLDKERLLNDLTSREFRQIFYAEHISTALPMQTRELRKKRKLSQAALAELVGTDQKNISNWENPNYEYKPQIGTLMRLADAFDVPLIVRFGSWEELWEWEFALSPERLSPPSFEEALPRLQRLARRTAKSTVSKRHKIVTSRTRRLDVQPELPFESAEQTVIWDDVIYGEELPSAPLAIPSALRALAEANTSINSTAQLGHYLLY
jgi:transcriptional regulator with XRE-family HTH domain